MTTITIDRAVIEQALEALEATSCYDIPSTSRVRTAIATLRAALARPSPATLIDPRSSLGEPIV